MIEITKSMPPGVESWGFGENLNALLAGDIAMWESWPPVGRWAAGYGVEIEALSWLPKSTVAGKIGYAMPPGERLSSRPASRFRYRPIRTPRRPPTCSSSG